MISTECTALFLFVIAIASSLSFANKLCKQPLDQGKECKEANSSVAWYFDDESDVCLAFKYFGCGGNSNRFSSAEECDEKCKPSDKGMCAMGKEPAKGIDGNVLTCNLPDNAKCPEGFRCTMSAFTGYCCPEKTEETFAQEYDGHCKIGQTVKNNRGDGWMQTHLGKSCEHDFCPKNTTCEQGEIFAHCCQ